MANSMIVKQVKDNEGRYNNLETAELILKQIFGEDFTYQYRYKGVEIKLITSPSIFYSTPIKGIQFSAGYRDKLIKRVMIKNETIDLDALKSKFAEVKKRADQIEAIINESRKRQDRAEALRERIANQVKHNENLEFNIDLEEHTPDAVKMDASINGTQLVNIEKILGQQSIDVELIVPEEHAVEIYNILNERG